MYISNIYIKNIRCFNELHLSLEKDGDPFFWNVILGENSTGKTCLLRAIAIGLCDESSGAALMKELKGDYLRDPSNDGIIEITVQDNEIRERYIITTTISTEYEIEKIRQSIEGDARKLREKLFVCGYGVQRSGSGTESYDQYSTLDAVFSLFNYYSSLQNPELIINRQSEQDKQNIFKLMKKLLMLNDDSYNFKTTKKGIIIESHGLSILLDSWADGYRSTFTWITDFIGWQIYADRLNSFDNLSNIHGIILLDEAELNLHPILQRYFVKNFKEHFPNVQFITTSHSPIIAAGAADFEDSNLLAFKRENGNITVIDNLPSFRGMTVDQVLTSIAFGLITTTSIGSIDNINRFSELMCKERTNEEESEYNQLKKALEQSLYSGMTNTDKIFERALDYALENILSGKPSKELDLLMKSKLQKFFNK